MANARGGFTYSPVGGYEKINFVSWRAIPWEKDVFQSDSFFKMTNLLRFSDELGE